MERREEVEGEGKKDKATWDIRGTPLTCTSSNDTNWSGNGMGMDQRSCKELDESSKYKHTSLKNL